MRWRLLSTLGGIAIVVVGLRTLYTQRRAHQRDADQRARISELAADHAAVVTCLTGRDAPGDMITAMTFHAASCDASIGKLAGEIDETARDWGVDAVTRHPLTRPFQSDPHVLDATCWWAAESRDQISALAGAVGATSAANPIACGKHEVALVTMPGTMTGNAVPQLAVDDAVRVWAGDGRVTEMARTADGKHWDVESIASPDVRSLVWTDDLVAALFRDEDGSYTVERYTSDGWSTRARLRFDRGPSLYAAGTALVVVAPTRRESADQGRTLVRRSIDGGATFTPPIAIGGAGREVDILTRRDGSVIGLVVMKQEARLTIARIAPGASTATTAADFAWPGNVHPDAQRLATCTRDDTYWVVVDGAHLVTSRDGGTTWRSVAELDVPERNLVLSCTVDRLAIVGSTASIVHLHLCDATTCGPSIPVPMPVHETELALVGVRFEPQLELWAVGRSASYRLSGFEPFPLLVYRLDGSTLVPDRIETSQIAGLRLPVVHLPEGFLHLRSLHAREW